MDSTRETHNPEFESKVCELLPDLAQLLTKPGAPKSDDIAVNLGIDLSQLQPRLASANAMSCYWDSSQSSFVCLPTSGDRAQQNSAVESKLSEMLPDLGQVLDKNGVSEPFTVNLRTDLSEFASSRTNSTMRCCFFPDGEPKCWPTYRA
jgi:hypothetical protein